MDWGVVDTEAATWTVPASRMKARGEHRVSLVAMGGCNLGGGPEPWHREAGSCSRRERGSPSATWPSPWSSDGSPWAMPCPHGFPVDLQGLDAGTDDLLMGLWWKTALAHTLGSATESAYARSDLFDRRRELMETWATHCASGGSPNGTNATSAGAAKQRLGERVRTAFLAASGVANRT